MDSSTDNGSTITPSSPRPRYVNLDVVSFFNGDTYFTIRKVSIRTTPFSIEGTSDNISEYGDLSTTRDVEYEKLVRNHICSMLTKP